MGYGRYVGRVAALAVATRMAVSIGVAALVVAATTPDGVGGRTARRQSLPRQHHRLSLCATT